MREQIATRFVAATPDDVFALITNPERLPEWNGAIVRVVDAPDKLRPGAEWVVQLSALGQSWPSRSTVVELDPDARLRRRELPESLRMLASFATTARDA